MADLVRHKSTRHRVNEMKYLCAVSGCSFESTRKDNLQQHFHQVHGLPGDLAAEGIRLVKTSRTQRRPVPFENFEDTKSLTPLQYAVKHNFLKDVETRLQQDDMDVNARSQEGSALDLAVRYGRIEALKLLLQHQGIDPNYSPMNAREAHPEKDPNRDESDGSDCLDDLVEEPLHEALIQDYIDVAKLLLRHKRIDVNRTRRPYRSNEADETALDIAMRKGQTDIVLILLSLGAISARKEVIIRTIRQRGIHGTNWRRIPMIY